MKISFLINQSPIDIEADGKTPLLWIIRDFLQLKGTKFGCGKAACGACTVLIDGVAVRCCTYPVELAGGKQITTIEGLESESGLHPVQQAWIDEIVPQCGYCQSGFMMAAAALLQNIPKPTDEDIDNQILNICRCGTHFRIRKAIHKAAEMMDQQENQKSTDRDG